MPDRSAPCRSFWHPEVRVFCLESRAFAISEGPTNMQKLFNAARKWAALTQH